MTAKLQIYDFNDQDYTAWSLFGWLSTVRQPAFFSHLIILYKNSFHIHMQHLSHKLSSNKFQHTKIYSGGT
jgi:hypothetical protein